MARYALVIGISQYRSPLKNLEKTTADAEAVAQILEQCGDFQKVTRLPARFNPDKNTYEMVSRNVTGAELGQALKSFFLERADKSEALIYFTGHGITVSDHLGQQKGYLATSDCIIEAQDNEIVEQQHGIALDSLNDLIRSSNLSSLVLLLDCCHGGYFLERNLVEQTLTTFSSQKDYYLITACRGFEQAWAIKTEQHDVFTGALLKGLAAENAGRDGRISGDRLFDYINAELQGSRQEPIRMGWGRSITLVTHTLQQSIAVSTEFRQENPYQGLQAFESEQEAYFCGREQAIWALLGRLTTNRFVAVIGPSGCGKSSLVRAGLLPQLGRDRLPGSSHWDTEIFTPGKHPLEKLLEILNRRHQTNQPFVLFIDQFEELFTLCEDNAERWNFIRLMAEEATGSERMTRVIVAIRAAFLEQCAPYPEAAELINQARPTTYIVPPLTFAELEAAIEHPASLHGVRFERGLVSQIANDVADRPGALPLMQYALMELWRVCIQASPSPQPILTLQGYQEIGGVRGALEKRANLLYQSFSLEDQAFIRRLFLELVQLNEGGEVTRRRANWSDLEAIADSPEQLDRVTRLLSGQQQRLIITSDKTVEVAHEALFNEWKLLHDWIEEGREDIQINRRLEAACREWQDTYQQSDDALLTGAPLATIEAWVKKSQPKLPLQEAELLQKSIEKRDRLVEVKVEQERKVVKAEKRRIQVIAIAGLVVGGLLSVLGLVQSRAERQAAESAKIGEIDALIASATTFMDSNRQLESLIESTKALKNLKQINSRKFSAQTLLRIQSLINRVREINRLEGHKGEVTSVNFSPDGNTIISASADGTIKLWSSKGKFIRDLLGHKGIVWSARFSPDGQTIASGSSDKNVKIWSKDGRILKTLVGHTDSVYDVSFSPDNQIVASASRDGTIKIWNVRTGRLIQNINSNPLLEQNYRVYGVDFDPSNNSKIASTGYLDGSINIWKIKGNEKPRQITLHKGIVSLVRFNYTGSILASSGYDGSINIWNATNNNLIGKIKVNDSEIYGLEFSPNSKLIASASKDEFIRIWSVDEVVKSRNRNIVLKQPLETLQGHTAPVNRVDFNPKNSQILASASDDKTIKIWRIHRNFKSDFENHSQRSDPLAYSCSLLRDYLMNNQNVPPENRSICPL
jgi:WD40 repeat protein/energy-coupling factor transporter ATP-binding protein EcfA2